MSKDDIRKFLESLDKCEEALKEYRAFKERESRFINELMDIITARTYEHFTTKTAYPHLNIQGDLDKNGLKQAILADKDFKFYGIWIFEEVDETVIDFYGYEIPTDRKLYYRKIEYPSFTEKTLQEEMKKFEEECTINLSPEQRATLYQSLKDDNQTDEFFINFKISIHKALKKLAFEYFPKITEISGAGIREIDTMLYTYMLNIYGNVMSIIDDAVDVSVKGE